MTSSLSGHVCASKQAQRRPCQRCREHIVGDTTETRPVTLGAGSNGLGLGSTKLGAFGIRRGSEHGAHSTEPVWDGSVTCKRCAAKRGEFARIRGGVDPVWRWAHQNLGRVRPSRHLARPQLGIRSARDTLGQVAAGFTFSQPHDCRRPHTRGGGRTQLQRPGARARARAPVTGSGGRRVPPPPGGRLTCTSGSPACPSPRRS